MISDEQTLYQNCIARRDLKPFSWHVFNFKYYEIVWKTYISCIVSWNYMRDV
jgi:hypothetical protein